MTRRSFACSVGLIVLMGAAARLTLILPAWDRPPIDPDRYLDLATSVASGAGFQVAGRATAYRPPLYPLLLAPGALVGFESAKRLALGLNLILGVATIGLVTLAARRWGLGCRSTLLASLLVALDPVLVSQAPAVMTETLAAALQAATLASLSARPRLRGLALGGVFAGLAALSRPTLLPVAVLIVVAIATLAPGSAWTRIKMAAVFGVTVAGVLAPWAIRNLRVLDEPVVTTTHGGYTFALANNAAYYDDVVNGPPGAVWSGPNQARWFAEINRLGAGLPEPEADRAFYREARRVIGERPGDFARACLARVGRFWAIAPSGRVYSATTRWGTAAWTLPFWCLVGVGLYRARPIGWPEAAAIAVPLALTLVHAVYWTDLRMRATAVPALALVAAGSLGVASRGDDRPRR